MLETLLGIPAWKILLLLLLFVLEQLVTHKILRPKFSHSNDWRFCLKYAGSGVFMFCALVLLGFNLSQWAPVLIVYIFLILFATPKKASRKTP
jgi:hypothetical protein